MSTESGLPCIRISARRILMGTDYRRAQAAEAIATAKAEIARRGLTVTVTKSFYALVVAQRKYATAQEALAQARRFLQLTEDTERVGQAAHSDVIKAQIQAQQQEAAFTEANLGMENARLDLSVLIFPSLDENFTAVDDLNTPRPLPTLGEAQEMAGRMNPDIRVATETLRQSNLDVRSAKSAFLPAISLDPVWGLEANCVATALRVHGHSRGRCDADLGLHYPGFIDGSPLGLGDVAK